MCVILTGSAAADEVEPTLRVRAHLPRYGIGTENRRRYCENKISAAIIGRPSCAQTQRSENGVPELYPSSASLHDRKAGKGKEHGCLSSAGPPACIRTKTWRKVQTGDAMTVIGIRVRAQTPAALQGT